MKNALFNVVYFLMLLAVWEIIHTAVDTRRTFLVLGIMVVNGLINWLEGGGGGKL